MATKARFDRVQENLYRCGLVVRLRKALTPREHGGKGVTLDEAAKAMRRPVVNVWRWVGTLDKVTGEYHGTIRVPMQESDCRAIEKFLHGLGLKQAPTMEAPAAA